MGRKGLKKMYVCEQQVMYVGSLDIISLSGWKTSGLNNVGVPTIGINWIFA